jgi:hypothetical protein
VSSRQDSFYTRWRPQNSDLRALRDSEGFPPERFLQAIWLQQRLRRERLATRDGRAVRVLHPGFPNREAGPDFRNAVIQFGGAEPLCGDVEVDVRTSGWHAHSHDRNRAFRSVILQVVWTAAEVREEGPPVLPIADALDSPIAELAGWADEHPATSLPDEFRGRCAALVGGLNDAQLQELLHQAALVRFRGKALRLAARAREAGWEQALWEGLFRALGYKHNVWPMQRLAELRTRWAPNAPDAAVVYSRLLGIANLIPSDITRTRTAADEFVRQLWDRWWRERDEFADCLLPRSLWRLQGVRPANHPQRRLALAAHWVAIGDLPVRLEHWCLRSTAEKRAEPAKLATLLHPPDDAFWNWHLTLRSKRTAKPCPLIGKARVTDLAVNVVLPWLLARATESGDSKLMTEFEDAYRAWPAGEDNAALKQARTRLLRRPASKIVGGAAAQQGLLQIVQDFCDHSNAICSPCRFPDLVQVWRVASQGGSGGGVSLRNSAPR